MGSLNLFAGFLAAAMEKPGRSLNPFESESGIGMDLKNVFVDLYGGRERGEAERERERCVL